MLDSAQEALAEENDEAWRRAAFVGWSIGAGGKQSFGDYLSSLRLGYEQAAAGPLQVQRTGLVSREEALANAERTLAYFRTHPKKVRGRSAQIAERARRREVRRARRAHGG